ncbi:MAG: hypothetical protein Q4F65_05030 [Propionibacteriaceae bacterium]|nr:hypothetical protein [Propionibacteriaceae bacterium]
MSTHTDTRVPVRSPGAQVPAVAAAVAGRWGWRLWWPVVAWLVVAAWSWVALTMRTPFDESGQWSTAASGAMLLGSISAIPVLWGWGARYALGLGHDRGVVFGVTAALSLLLPAVLHVVSLAAGILELRVLGEGGIHVFALETSNKMGTWDSLWNGSWTFALIFVLPVIVGAVLVSVAVLRWGALGLLTAPVVPLALLAMVVLSDVIPLTMVGPVTVAAAALVAAWFVFRRTPA